MAIKGKHGDVIGVAQVNGIRNFKSFLFPLSSRTFFSVRFSMEERFHITDNNKFLEYKFLHSSSFHCQEYSLKSLDGLGESLQVKVGIVCRPNASFFKISDSNLKEV